MSGIRTYLYASCLLLGLGICTKATAQDIVVNKGLALEHLDHNTLRAIIGMRLRVWPDGTPVQVFVLPDRHPLHQRFCKQTLKYFPHRLRRGWDRLVYAGIGQAPTEVRDQQEMRRQVAATPGAIGYLEKDMIDDSVSEVTIE